MARFSKEVVLAAIDKKIEALQNEWGFDPNNGTAQLKGKLAGQDAAVAYGTYRALDDLAEQIADGSLVR